MEGSGEKKIKEALKSSRIYLIITIISAIVIVIGIVMVIKAPQIANKEPKDLLQMRKDEMNKEKSTSEEYVYLDINEISEAIVIESSDDSSIDKKYYFTITYFTGEDGKTYYMVNVAKVPEYEYLEMNDLVNQFYEYDETEEYTKRLEGTTRQMSDDLKKLVIESYEKVFAQEGITEEDLIEITGTTYLQVDSKPEDTVKGIAAMLISFGAIVFLICGITYLLINGKTRKTIKRLKKVEELDDVYSELEVSNEEFMKTKTFFTKNYIVDASEGLEVIKYSDIKWIYPYTHKINFAEVEKAFIIRTNNKKQYKVAQIRPKKEKLEEYEKIWQILIEKAPQDALKGYTKENENIYKEILNNK